MIKKIKELPKQWLILLIIILLLLISGIIYFSYALFSTTVEKGGTLNIVTGEFSYIMKSSDLTDNQITVEAGKTKIFSLEIENTNSRDTSYGVYYIMKSPSSMPSGAKIGYTDYSNTQTKGELITKGEKKTFEFIIENKSNQTVTIEIGVQGGLVNQELQVTKGVLITEKITSLASSPELDTNMIPVKYDDAKKSWIKADISNPKSNEWYNYDNKIWANAITFDQNKVLDLSGNNNNGTNSGAILSSGLASLDGKDDFINCNLAKYDFKNQQTLAIKVKFKGLNTNGTLNEFFGNWESSGGGLSYASTTDGTPGIWQYLIYSNEEAKYVGPVYRKNIEIGKEYTIIGSYDGTTMKFYMDGVLLVSLDLTATIKPSPFPFFLGANPSGSIDAILGSFHSNIDVKEVMILSRAFTTDEVNYFTNNQSSKISKTNLLAHYDFKKISDLPINSVIPMDMINNMLVWVPRYRYAIPKGSGAREIKIIFENKSTPKSTGNAVDSSYLTHPAFTFGTTELNGMWVGKFEMGGTDSYIMIKPNELSYTEQTVSTFFTKSREMQKSGNAYGYTDQINTHMMKNSEWGAVAYLTQSKYGRCTNGVCEEVTINNINANNGRSITGCAGDTVSAAELIIADCPDTNRYSTEKGVKASTTGNVYGIYDMSGGSWEYVMGNYKSYSGYTAISYTVEQAKTILGTTNNTAVGIWNSGFNGPVYGKALDGVTNISWTSGIPFPEQKYYDLYKSTNSSTACEGKFCVGHAIDEVSGWNNDHFLFLLEDYPWFLRGGRGAEETKAGIFVFSPGYGNRVSVFSFRLTITNN